MGFTLPSQIKIGQIKIGKSFKGVHGIEEIVEIEDLTNVLVFKTCIEEDEGITTITYCGDKEGNFLKHIYTTGRGAIRHYSFKDNSSGYREKGR